MSMIETHEKALDSENVVYHEFLLIYKKSKKLVYGVIEGKEDPSFYRGLIENMLPSEWRVKLITAGNKVKVLKTHESFDWNRFDKQQICFFIDSDLSVFIRDIWLQDQNIYVTDGYSIENEVLNHTTLERVLEEILNIVELDEKELETIANLFESSKSYFSEKLTPIMAQIIAWKRDEQRTCLENIQMKDLFEFEKGKITLKSTYQNVDERLGYAADKCNLVSTNPEVISEIENEFIGKSGPEKYIRGKYLLWFFINFAFSVHDSIMEFCSRYKSKPKAKVSLGIKNALVIIGPRVRIPPSLQEFVSNNYCGFITSSEVAA